MNDVKLIAFDVFGTVFDLTWASREDVRAYGEHIRRPEWSRLRLPKSWETMPAHPDSAEGIAMLRQKYLVVTCSNGPLGLLTKLSKHNGISWDAITPLELNKVFKPNPLAYLTLCDAYDVRPSEVLMVTANKDFGDLEAARALGMQSILIRGDDGGPQTIVELARQLGVDGTVRSQLLPNDIAVEVDSFEMRFVDGAGPILVNGKPLRGVQRLSVEAAACERTRVSIEYIPQKDSNGTN